MSEIIKQINVDGVDYDIVSESAERKIAEIDEKIKSLESNTTSDGLTKTTYSELKALRDNGELIEGHLYRITDYVTTTTQDKTKSANHPFDIIVLATSTNELSHIARAIQHEGDTYFDGNDLGAWELWYDLDNDKSKYEWADATNGKGVIYRMIDEKINDCPYDFKNILFYRSGNAYPTSRDSYYYTFSYIINRILYDGTVETQVTTCYNNRMKIFTKNKKKSLNNNVFKNSAFDVVCHSNSFGNDCSDNSFSSDCSYNTFGNYCHSNSFSYECHSNSFGNGCYSNAFGNYCSDNSFSSDCSYNTFGNHCHSNSFGHACYSNTFGKECISNTLNNAVNYRYIDRSQTSITFNDEYYDDESGKLVPIKHPDLSTQPSILPYKFMGQYVYEQLVKAYIDNDSNTSDIYVIWPSSLDKGKIYLDIKAILTYNKGLNDELSIAIPIVTYSNTGESGRIWINGSNIYEIDRYSPIYLYVVYTSMPKEGGDYYGYNNY